MTSNWNADLTYKCHPRDSHMDRQFTAVDFVPNKLGKSGFLSQTNYESFRILVDRANQWLSANPYCKIVTCETVDFRNKTGEAGVTKMTYVEHGKSITSFLRGLRLWVEPSSETNHPIDYMNILPQVAEKKGIFQLETYDTIDAVISRTNEILRNRPLPGKIITIENQEMKTISVAWLDSDKTNWEERGDSPKKFLFLIRIFYEKSNEDCDQQIGVQDFVPNLTKKSGVLSLPEYEPFNKVVAKASDWCSCQYGIKVCNIQALNIQVTRDDIVDTKNTYYREHGRSRTYFVRILRVNYVQSNLYIKVSPFPGITHKTFTPVQLTKKLVCNTYETLLETKNRVEEWIRVTGVHILNAETGVVRYRALTRGMGDEETFHYNEAERNEYWVFVIRLYIIGSYQEPPPGLLTPVPNIIDEGCILL